MEFGLAVALATQERNLAPIYEFFDRQLQVQIDKIERTAPEIGEQALRDLLLRAFDSNGQVLCHGKLEVKAGLATYNRWMESTGIPEPSATSELSNKTFSLLML